jgi:hypothetical protein
VVRRGTTVGLGQRVVTRVGVRMVVGIPQRPWFIGLVSSLVIDGSIKKNGLVPGSTPAAFDRAAFEASTTRVPEELGRREDFEVPCAAGGGSNVARLYTPQTALSEAAVYPRKRLKPRQAARC